MGALGRGGIFGFEGFRLDCNAGALFRQREDGAFVPVAMGSRALDVLGVLVGQAGDLVSRDEFMAAVWPATAVEDGNLNMQVAALRRVLDEGRADGSCIQTIRDVATVSPFRWLGSSPPPRWHPAAATAPKALSPNNLDRELHPHRASPEIFHPASGRWTANGSVAAA